jgi:hypothetical protein
VSVLYGTSGGLTRIGGELFTQVGSAPEVLDQFGAALAAGDFDRDGFADLAAGAPLEAVGSILEAGAVSALYGSGAGSLGSVGSCSPRTAPGSVAVLKHWTGLASPWPPAIWAPRRPRLRRQGRVSRRGDRHPTADPAGTVPRHPGRDDGTVKALSSLARPPPLPRAGSPRQGRARGPQPLQGLVAA